MFKIVWINSIGDVFKERLYSEDEYTVNEALQEFIRRDDGTGFEIFAIDDTIKIIEI